VTVTEEPTGHAFERTVEPALARGACPHLAVLLSREDELPAVLASFYALGAKRRGWLVHRTLPGGAERERELLRAAGLEVDAMERDGSLAVHTLDPSEPPEDYGRDFEPALEDALGKGYTALWYSRFAVGAEVAGFETVLAYDRFWERRFHDRPVVTLCPFIVGGLGAPRDFGGFASLAESHDGVVVPAASGFDLVDPRGRADPAPA
jgi:hypothetical protein